MTKPKTYQGVSYWPTYESARAAAAERGFSTERIIKYGRGWAVQAYISGPYLNVTKG
jgi:hypothetical protein